MPRKVGTLFPDPHKFFLFPSKFYPQAFFTWPSDRLKSISTANFIFLFLFFFFMFLFLIFNFFFFYFLFLFFFFFFYCHRKNSKTLAPSGMMAFFTPLRRIKLFAHPDTDLCATRTCTLVALPVLARHF